MKQFVQFRRFVRASFAENHNKQIDAAANAVLIHLVGTFHHSVWEKSPFSFLVKRKVISYHRAPSVNSKDPVEDASLFNRSQQRFRHLRIT